MHESRLVTEIVNEAVRIATLDDSESVHEIQVTIGALSHVTPLSLESHLREASAGTLIEEATFTITKSSDPYASDALDVRLVSLVVAED